MSIERGGRRADGPRWHLWAGVGLAAMALIALATLALGPRLGAPTATPDFSPALEMTTTLDDLRLTLRLMPARTGQNAATVELTDLSGEPVEDANRVDVRLTYLDLKQGTQVYVAQPQGDGQYTAQGELLTANGRWQAEVLVRRPAVGDVRTAFRFVVTTEGAAASLPSDITALGEALEVRNPIPASRESFARGEQIYRTECQVCHGPRGRGDGPAAASLKPRPADFRVHLAEGHTDGELFFWISEGVAETGMPGFKDRVSVEDRWHAVNFIKTFAPVAQ